MNADLTAARMGGRACYANHLSCDGSMEDVLNEGQDLRYIHIHSALTGEHTREPNPEWTPEVEAAWTEGWNQAKADSIGMPVVGYWTS